jgi:hypothetical protein
LSDTANALRHNLLRWSELLPQSRHACDALEAFLRAAETFDSANALDDACFDEPDALADRRADLAKLRDLNKADRADRLATLHHSATIWLPVAQEYGELVTSIKQQASIIAANAEKAGIGSAALLLFAADFDERLWEAARAVVERTSVIATNKSFVPTARQQEILNMLDGKAKKLSQLADQLKVEESSLSGRDLKQLREQGLVDHHKGIGFYRPDAPPPGVATT